MANRISLGRLEFYITNVCNLTCNGCNRYNNYHFTGWQAWDDYKDNIAQWAEKIEINHPVILGGEPLLNPTITQWITGIRAAWPELSGVQVQSNGTRIDCVKGLYDALNHDNWIGVSIHDPADREEIFNRIRNFLVHPIEETADSNHFSGSHYQFRDANRKYIFAWMNDHFVQSNIIERPDGSMTLYQSDPNKAHENCTFRQFKNYHWIAGKIYKCGPAALMPEFDKQYPLDISAADRELINSYRPLSIEEFDERGEEFFNTIDDVIPQCKFCPETYEYKPITFTPRKKDWRLVSKKDIGVE